MRESLTDSSPSLNFAIASTREIAAEAAVTIAKS